MRESTTRLPPGTVDKTQEKPQSADSLPKTNKNTKQYRVLKALLNRSYNRFEAARELHDWALHSTVSTIQKTWGIRVDRQIETVPGYQGEPTRVCRYWISSDQCERTHQILGK